MGSRARWASIALLTLCFHCFSQGVDVHRSQYLKAIPAEQIYSIDPVYSTSVPTYILETDSGYGTWCPDTKHSTIQWFEVGETPFSHALVRVSVDRLVGMRYGKVYEYHLHGAQWLRNSETVCVEAYQDEGVSADYAFADAHFAYFFSYYNTSDRRQLGHDVLYCVKFDLDKGTVVRVREMDMGKDILFSPFNHQQMAFNGQLFVFGTSLGLELMELTRDFVLLRRIRLWPEWSASNQFVVDWVFPDNSIADYVGYPKEVISRYDSAGLFDFKAIHMLLFVDEHTLLVNVRETHRESHHLWMIRWPDAEVVSDCILRFHGALLSPTCWTLRLYGSMGELSVLNVAEVDSTHWHYRVSNVSFYPRDNGLEKCHWFIQMLDSMHVQSFLVADGSYCSKCLGEEGLPENVAVFLRKPKGIGSRLTLHQTRIVHDWRINGPLIFLNPRSFAEIREVLRPNIIYIRHLLCDP